MLLFVLSAMSSTLMDLQLYTCKFWLLLLWFALIYKFWLLLWFALIFCWLTQRIQPKCSPVCYSMYMDVYNGLAVKRTEFKLFPHTLHAWKYCMLKRLECHWLTDWHERWASLSDGHERWASLSEDHQCYIRSYYYIIIIILWTYQFDRYPLRIQDDIDRHNQ